MDRVREAAAALRACLAELDADIVDVPVAAVLVEELAATENACVAAKIRLAIRAARGGAHQARGFARVADWVASASGSTLREARCQLDAAAAVDRCPQTRDALARGVVSFAQAAEIARTEAEVPGTEAELLELALTSTLGAVRDRGRTRRLDAMRPEDLHAKQHATRSFHHWRDELGMIRVSMALTPEVGVPFVKAVDLETDRRYRAAWRVARAEGRVVEPRDALAADAFAQCLNGEAKRAGSGMTTNIVIDWPALVRGHANDGERCHIVGGGPIPVRVARELFADSFVKVILMNGTKVQRVKHFGRHLHAEVRTALELGPPPGFRGVVCSEDGCERRYGIEWDHIDPLANDGSTEISNLQPRCGPHHWDKTQRDRAAGRLGVRVPDRESSGRSPP
jgi:hypothetical protein